MQRGLVCLQVDYVQGVGMSKGGYLQCGMGMCRVR